MNFAASEVQLQLSYRVYKNRKHSSILLLKNSLCKGLSAFSEPKPPGVVSCILITSTIMQEVMLALLPRWQ